MTDQDWSHVEFKYTISLSHLSGDEAVRTYGFGDNSFELHFKVSNEVVQYEVINTVNGDIYSEQKFNATMDLESLAAPQVTAYSHLPY